MKTITLELSEEQLARLTQAVGCRYETLSGLLKARLFDLLEDPTDPFDPRWLGRRDREREFLRRIA
jgi:hypothetical protein